MNQTFDAHYHLQPILDQGLEHARLTLVKSQKHYGYEHIPFCSKNPKVNFVAIVDKLILY